MASQSEEGNASGLGWIGANVVKFRVRNQIRNKVPHIGWNTLKINRTGELLKGVDQGSEFYFAHSYHFESDMSPRALASTTYDYEFLSAFEHDNIFGTQFHPKRAERNGHKIINNFLGA